MPFYDLKCRNCGTTFNVKASIGERENNQIKCPSCGKNELDAVFSNVNIIKSRSSSSAECPNIHRCGGCCNH